MAERLLDDDPRTAGAARLAEPLHDQLEQHGRDGQVVRRPSGGAELSADGLERGRGLVVAIDVTQEPPQLAERRGVEPAVRLEAVVRAGLALSPPPAAL